jgi:hypothetical protein
LRFSRIDAPGWALYEALSPMGEFHMPGVPNLVDYD